MLETLCSTVPAGGDDLVPGELRSPPCQKPGAVRPWRMEAFRAVWGRARNVGTRCGHGLGSPRVSWLLFAFKIGVSDHRIF